MEKVRVNYTDNTKEGMKKKRRESILKKLLPIKNDIDDKVDILSEQFDELEIQLAEAEQAQEHMDMVYGKISNGEPVCREDLKACEYMHEEQNYW